MPLLCEPVVAPAVLLYMKNPKSLQGLLSKAGGMRKCLPEDGEAQRPEHQWLPQFKFCSFVHQVPTTKYKGSVQSWKQEWFLPAKQNKKTPPVKCLISARYTAESHMDITAKGLCASLKGNVLTCSRILAELIVSVWNYMPAHTQGWVQADLTLGKFWKRQIWLPFFASFRCLNFCEE